jgi:DNA-binding transcriptional regulator YiaG
LANSLRNPEDPQQIAKLFLLEATRSSTGRFDYLITQSNSVILSCRHTQNGVTFRKKSQERNRAMPAPKAIAIYDARRKPLVRRKVVQRRYGVSARTLDNWMKERRIPFYKVGGMLFFNIEKCDAALERFEIKPV